MNGDLELAVQMLAADNARMIDILLVAEKIIEYVESIGLVKFAGHRRMEALLEAYYTVRNGQ